MPPESKDPALDEVAAAIFALDPTGHAWGGVIRRTFDMVYNGQETGRYRLDQLMKTEKTHIGSLFEINAQRQFGFAGGDKLDFSIAGHEVDAKWSQHSGGWMLPHEVYDELALVGTGDDQKAMWSLGLKRVTAEHRREKTNQDKKSQLNPAGNHAIRWLWRDADLPPNVLLQLDPATVAHIFDHRDGTQRLHRLFRAAEGRLVHRTTVATVAQQLDSQKRVRGNGGSRTVLAPEGFVILSGVYHGHIATALGLPVPSREEYVSARVVPSSGGAGARIAGRYWRLLSPGEQVREPAPTLPERGNRE